LRAQIGDLSDRDPAVVDREDRLGLLELPGYPVDHRRLLVSVHVGLGLCRGGAKKTPAMAGVEDRAGLRAPRLRLSRSSGRRESRAVRSPGGYAASGASSKRSRVRVGSTLMPGPIVDVSVIE